MKVEYRPEALLRIVRRRDLTVAEATLNGVPLPLDCIKELAFEIRPRGDSVVHLTIWADVDHRFEEESGT